MKLATLSTVFLLSITLACGGASDSSAMKPSEPTPTPTEGGEVNPIPAGFTSITPIIVVSDVDEALAFYAEALGATAKFSLPGPNGKSMHGEMVIGDSTIMLSAENIEANAKSPKTLGGTNGSLLVYVADVDAALALAVDAGAVMTMPAEDMFWGDRYAGLVDPFGHMWGLATHREDLTGEETSARAEAWLAAAMKGEKYKLPALTKPAASWKPAGYRSVTATVLIAGGAEALGFYTDAFGAIIADKMPMPDGKLMHASLKVGDSIVHLSSEFPEMEPTHKAAVNLGGAPVGLMFYVADTDARMATAVKAGATEVAPATDMFWGDRWGLVRDPAGNEWGIATHLEDLSKEQILERMQKQFGETK